ncbi:MAG: hypothetical protein ACLS7Z_07685 [Christensenellales bacterium]
MPEPSPRWRRWPDGARGIPCAREKGLSGWLPDESAARARAALLFVGRMLGFVKSDPQTGALTLRFDNLPKSSSATSI